MHVDEFIFNCCVSSMISDDLPTGGSTESAMNVFSIDENKIRDANGIIFAEAITCYKCTFCGKMFAAMEVVLTHYQSNHRCSVIPLLKGMTRISTPKYKTPKTKIQSEVTHNGVKSKQQTKSEANIQIESTPKRDLRNTRSNNILAESAVSNGSRLLRESTKNLKMLYSVENKKKKFKCHYPGCTKSFSYRNGLEAHQKTHKKPKSYKCVWSDCKFKCSDLAGLEFHKKTHSGDNPYQCSWPGCSQSFADATAKDQHLHSQHIGDKILECDYPGCSAKFNLSFDRDRHKATHLGKKISSSPIKPNHPLLPVKRPGRPPNKRNAVIEISSSGESESSDDTEEEEEEEEEEEDGDNEEIVEEVENSSEQRLEENKSEQPLDLSKTATDLKSNASKDSKIESKTASKRKRSSPKEIPKTVFRCDYPGCRKTFTDGDLLKDHERDTHKTPSADGRSRYERRCKGNLYYKI